METLTISDRAHRLHLIADHLRATDILTAIEADDLADDLEELEARYRDFCDGCALEDGVVFSRDPLPWHLR